MRSDLTCGILILQTFKRGLDLDIILETLLGSFAGAASPPRTRSASVVSVSGEHRTAQPSHGSRKLNPGLAAPRRRDPAAHPSPLAGEYQSALRRHWTPL